MFTLGWNMSSLITNKTCFVNMKTVHIGNIKHLNMILILSRTETTSQGSFNHDQTKHIQNGGWMQREGQCPKEPKLGLLQWNMGWWRNTTAIKSVMGRKQNICENNAAKLNDKCEYQDAAWIMQPCMKHVWNQHLMQAMQQQTIHTLIMFRLWCEHSLTHKESLHDSVTQACAG